MENIALRRFWQRIGLIGIGAALLIGLGFFLTSAAREIKNNRMNERLINAAALGDSAQVEQLIQSGADINYLQVDLQSTPLMSASALGDTKTVLVLLRYHPNLNYATREGQTALTTAREYKNPEVVRLLKAAGAKE